MTNQKLMIAMIDKDSGNIFSCRGRESWKEERENIGNVNVKMLNWYGKYAQSYGTREFTRDHLDGHIEDR